MKNWISQNRVFLSALIAAVVLVLQQFAGSAAIDFKALGVALVIGVLGVAENYPDFEICWFGHIGDGNLHLNILKPADLSKDEFFAKCQVVNKYVFDTVKKYDGSISAEHGVGMTKKPYLEYSRSAEEIEYMKALKKVFDPQCIMNPGKLFDL